MGKYEVLVHSLRFYIFRILSQQNFHLYQSINLLNKLMELMHILIIYIRGIYIITFINFI